MKNSILFYFFLILTLLIVIGIKCDAQSAKSEEIPKGRIERFIFKESKIFPGTQREVTVYIPAQIDSSKPACVFVQQDGYGSHTDSIFNLLIARKEMPVTVGVFISSGSLSPPNSKTLMRPNRCFEYDGVSDNYVRFLLEELLPFVASQYKLNLSNSGNDRCIAGGSSGGIAAFNAAWQRPDAFSRVYCISGSFVAFRGGNEFPTLVRKTEPKAIRALLSTGTNDMENCAGDWTLLDMEMDKALKFSGYDYKFHVIEGGHGAGGGELFEDGMHYLWKDWPAPVMAGIGAPRVRDIILPGESWQLVATGYPGVSGPACNPKGEVFFADTINNKIYKIDSENHITTFLENADHCNGLSFGPNGELYTVSANTGKIICYNEKGEGSLYADGIPGQYVLAAPDEGLYVSTGQINTKEQGKVWMVKNNHKTLCDKAIPFPTGMAMSPDHWLLAVADNQSHWVYSYEINDDGLLINKERFFWLHVQDWEENSGAESVCYDKEGHLYVATRYGVQVCAWDGPSQVILPIPGNIRVTGLCFGGVDLDNLFAFCGDKIYKRKVKNHLLGAFTPWTRMTPGSL